MKINFPEGFYFVKPVCFHTNSGTYTQAETLYNNRMLICQSFKKPMAANATQTVVVIDILNPDHAGPFQGFYLETMEGLTPNIIESITIPGPVRIYPGSTIITVRSDSLLLAVNTSHYFDIRFENDVPASGQVWIQMPSGFRYKATNCTLLRPLQPQIGGNNLLLTFVDLGTRSSNLWTGS